MSKKAYIGVSGKARKVKKGYIGVSGKARKIKKAYIGIGGKARPFWAGGTLVYYGTATALSVSRGNIAATTVGNYALFGGGHSVISSSNSPSNKNVVDTYNKSLTKGTATTLSIARSELAATTVGNYALFGGGETNSTSESSYVDTYNNSLTKSTTTKLTGSDRQEYAATTVGNYALFAGGNVTNTYTGANNSVTATVDAYNTSLVKSTATNLSEARYGLAATTVGSYALFAGGRSGTGNFSVVDAYNTSLTKSTPTELNNAKYWMAATTVGDYALFAGGSPGTSSMVGINTTTTTYFNTVDAYNTSLTKSTPTELSEGRSNLSATTLGDFALIGGGLHQQVRKSSMTTNTYSSVVDVYNTSLTRSSVTGLSTAREVLAATTVGDYALFAGGSDGGAARLAIVDAYTLV